MYYTLGAISQYVVGEHDVRASVNCPNYHAKNGGNWSCYDRPHYTSLCVCYLRSMAYIHTSQHTFLVCVHMGGGGVKPDVIGVIYHNLHRKYVTDNKLGGFSKCLFLRMYVCDVN